MSDRTNFRLPGHEFNPFSERKCLLSLLTAYSKQWNPRNLEAPWYEPWAQIFADLVAGHPSLSVAPQPYLWYDPTSDAHTTPGPAHLLSTEDEQLNELHDDVGNVSIGSIRSISIPSHRNRSRIPDLAITRRVSFIRPDNTTHILHLDRRVTYVGFPVLVELKCSGRRCNNIRTSISNAVKQINLACDQLYRQAHHLFRMYPHQQSVILIAVSGFWWTYFICPRALAEKFNLPEDEEEEEEEAATPLPDQNGIHAFLAQNPSESNEVSIQALQEQIYGFPLNALQDAGAVPSRAPVSIHTVLPQDQMSLHEGGWSNYLLYGTPPSNQVLSLILDRLHSVVHIYYDGRMG